MSEKRCIFAADFEGEILTQKQYKEMKNIFKFMGIALMATSLLVACNPEKEDEEDPIDTTPVTPNPPAPQATIDVTWNGAAKTMTDVKATADNDVFTSGSYLLQIDACEGVDANGDIEGIQVVTYFVQNAQSPTQLVPGYMVTADANGNSLEYYYPTEVYETAGIQVGNAIYGDYQFLQANATPTFGAFDATKLIVDCDLNYKFYAFGTVIAAIQEWQNTYDDTVGMIVNGQLADTAKYIAYMQAGQAAEQAAIQAAEKKDMTMKLGNYTFKAGKIQ